MKRSDERDHKLATVKIPRASWHYRPMPFGDEDDAALYSPFDIYEISSPIVAVNSIGMSWI